MCQTAFDATGLPPHYITNSIYTADDAEFVFDVDTLIMSDDGGFLSIANDNPAQYAWSPIVQEHSHEYIFAGHYNAADDFDVIYDSAAGDTYGMMGGERFERGCQLISGFPKRFFPCACWSLQYDHYGTPRVIYNGEANNGVDDTLESGTSFRQDPTSNPWEYKPALVSYCSTTPGKCQGLNPNDPAPPPPPLTPGALHSKDLSLIHI